MISLLLISRFVYNLFAITAVSLKLPEFNFDFINVSDQADLVDLSEKKKFISFFVVLAIWELIPTIVIISLFRLRRNDSLTNFRSTSTSSFARKSIFVDSGITSENEFYEPSNEQRRLINDDFESLSEEQSSSGHNNRNYCSINSYKIWERECLNSIKCKFLEKLVHLSFELIYNCCYLIKLFVKVKLSYIRFFFVQLICCI